MLWTTETLPAAFMTYVSAAIYEHDCLAVAKS